MGGGHKVQAERNQDAVGVKGRNYKRCLVSSEVQPTPEPWTPGSMADFYVRSIALSLVKGLRHYYHSSLRVEAGTQSCLRLL